MLRAVDEAVAQHFTEHPVPSRHRAVVKSFRPVVRRALWQDSEIGHLGQGQVLGILAEIGERRRLDPESVAAKRDLVEVEFHDLLLGQRRLDPVGEQRFLDLARVGDLIADQQVLRDLLRDRGRADRPPGTRQVGEHRPDDAGIVHAAMFEERPVLGRHIGLDQQRRKLVVAQLDAPLAGIGIDGRSVDRPDVRGQRRLVFEQRGRVG